MNSNVKKLMVIFGSILLAVAIIFGILLVVPIRIAPVINDPESVLIIQSGSLKYNSDRPASTKELIKESETSGKLYTEFVSEFKQSTKFTALRGIFEGRWFPTYKLETKEDEDGETQLAEYSRSDIESLTGSTTRYLIVYTYDKLQTAKIGKTEIKYDRAYFYSSDSAYEIMDFDMYLFDHVALETDEDFVAYKIKCAGNTSRTFDVIEKVQDEL